MNKSERSLSASSPETKGEANSINRYRSLLLRLQRREQLPMLSKLLNLLLTVIADNTNRCEVVWPPNPLKP